MHLIVVAEGDDFGGAREVSSKIIEQFPLLDVRTSVLGHIQRGGNPSCADRILASRLGHAAILALKNGNTQVMAGIVNNEVVYTPFKNVVKGCNPISKDMLELIRVLAI